MTRRHIPEHIRQAVLLEAGYRCANPVCRHVLTLELHHIQWVRDGGGNDPQNLIALCPNCHTLHTRGYIPASAIEAWKSLLVAIGNPNRAAVDLLLVLANEQTRIASEPTDKAAPPFRFTGDSLAFLAPLMTSGLLEISRRFSGHNSWGGGHPSFEVTLTERGARLVKAWRSGSPAEVRTALEEDSEPPAPG